MQEKRWQYVTAQPIPGDWQLSGGPLPSELLQVLYARGIRDAPAAEAFLLPEHYRPAPPSELPALEHAVEILTGLLQHPAARVLVWGDFDTDGQTATAILVEGLRKLGLQVDFYIPDRQSESHGLHLSSLRMLVEENPPALLLVCDTGSANTDVVTYAKSRGILVIIADHHSLPEALPPADALINPLLLAESDHPLRTLSGVGVSYLLLSALYNSLGRGHQVGEFLDLVALGLVADVVELVGDTRYLAQMGLRALRRTERLGLIALCRQLQVDLSHVTEEDIGFRIAPALNALGRLDTAAKGVALLTTRDTTEAEVLAQEAIGLNRRRQLLTDQILASAQEQIEHDPTLLTWEALVLASPNWHSGIVGIVAARLAETYHRPVALLVMDRNGGARGSIRSVPGYHIGAALARLKDILIDYGGHEGAGGLSIDGNHLPLLRRRLSEAFATIREVVSAPSLTIDATLPLERLTLDFAYQVQRLAPFGAGNPAPVFATPDLKLASAARLGSKDQHRRLTVEDRAGHRQTVLWWNSADFVLPDGRFDLAYTVGISVYQDSPGLQVMLKDWQQVEAPPPDPVKSAEVIDCRAGNPGDTLHSIHARESDAVIWAEGYPSAQSPGLSLSRLSPAEALIVYTIPAAQEHLVEAISTVRPQRVYFIAAPAPVASLPVLLKTLDGLLETIIERQAGETSLTQLRERLATTVQLVQLGLKVLAGHHHFKLTIGGRGKVVIKQAPDVSDDDTEQALSKLERAWNEVQAFRDYLRRVPIEHLLD